MNGSPQPRRHIDAAIFFILLAAPSLLMIRALAHHEIPHFMDPALYFFPLRVQAARILAAGEWPLWNRALMGGMPLLSNPQSAVVYPFHWPTLLWPNGFWFTFPQLFQFGLYGALTAWALRKLGCGRWSAAWIGALAIAGDYGWSRLQFGNYMNVLPWWPLWIGAAEGFSMRNAECGMRNREENPKSEIRNPKQTQNSNDTNEPEAAISDIQHGQSEMELPKSEIQNPKCFPIPRSAFHTPHFFFGILAVAMPILSGAHQPAAYGLAAMAGYTMIQLFISRGERLQRLLFLILTFSIGILLAAPGWLPQIAFLRETSRAGGLTADQAIEGSIGSLPELGRALIGDWDSAFQKRGSGIPRRWADAESQAAIGALALLLAFIPPAAGARRNRWLALLLAAFAAAAMSLRPVAATVVEAIPKTGVFHDPRRWLGIAQWLFLMAAGLGADRLIASIRRLPARCVVGALLIASVVFQGWFTWMTTELRTIPARELTDPSPAPLIAAAKLQPGERFFSLDWERQSSYEYRRPDLTDWALPNMAMLWGLEDLGGYEPAQSLRWRAYMNAINYEPSRRLWIQHFSLPTDPWRADLLDQANVRAGIFPRWGIPLYFRLQDQAMTWGAIIPRLDAGRMSVVALMVGAKGAEVSLRPAEERQAELLSDPQSLSFNDDLIAAGTTSTLPRVAPLGTGFVQSARTQLPFSPGASPAGSQWKLGLGVPSGAAPNLIDVYAWNQQLARLWRPEEIRAIAARMIYQGKPARTTWVAGEGSVVRETIRHNSLEVEVNVASAQAALVIHDAWWLGWQASLADGSPVKVQPVGPWRGIVLPAGRSVVRMDYRPEGLRLALNLACGGGILYLLIVFFTRRHASRKISAPLPPS